MILWFPFQRNMEMKDYTSCSSSRGLEVWSIASTPTLRTPDLFLSPLQHVPPQNHKSRQRYSWYLLRTVVNRSQGVPHFWDASDIVRERIKWGPRWFSTAGKVFDPSLCLACWTCASFMCWSKGSPSTLEVSSLTVVYFSELTPLKNIKVRPWLKNLFLSFKSLCLYDIVFH